MRISVIISFDHVDDNLNRCVESFLFGNDNELEIVLSPYFDISPDDKELISQVNSNKVLLLDFVSDNISAARNYALAQITGDYVLFPEPDDWVSCAFIQTLREALQSNDVDLLVYSYYVHRKEKKGFSQCRLKKKNDGFHGRNLVCPTWNKVFAVRIIQNNKIEYTSDLSFIIDYSKNVKQDRIICFEKPLYYRGQEIIDPITPLSSCDKTTYMRCFHLLGFTKQCFFKESICIKCDMINDILFSGIKNRCREWRKRQNDKHRRMVLRRVIRPFVSAKIPEGISIISQNCIGGMIYHDLRRQNLSPTINLYFMADDFMRFVKDLPYYLSLEPQIKWGETFPVGVLDDIHIYFRHYKTCSGALDAWNRRKTRMRYDKIVVLCSDRYEFSDNSFEMWKTIKYPKLLFTCKKKYADDSAVYFKQYSGEEYVPDLIPYREFYKDDRVKILLEKS